MPRVADLYTELETRIGRQVADVGLYLDPVADDATGVTTARVYREGIRRGLAAVGVATADIYPVDSDVANLSSFATDRVIDEAERFTLKRVQNNWYRAMQAKGVQPLAPLNDSSNIRGGTVYAEKQGIDARVSSLNEECAAPYREPFGSIVVNPATEWRDFFGGRFFERDGGCR